MSPRFNTFEEAFDDLHENSVEEYLRADAKAQGISWSDYCYEHGIVGAAQTRRVRRHEVATYYEMTPEEEDE